MKCFFDCCDHFLEKALAALYVFEGSTLGGEFISKKIKTFYWQHCDPIIFMVLNPYQQDSPSKWSLFKKDLQKYTELNPEATQLIPMYAKQIFDNFQQYLKHYYSASLI